MKIDAETRLAAIFKWHPRALDAVIRLHPRFQKLRNPLLRRLMAGRTSLLTASQVGGVPLDRFYESLSVLGFETPGTVNPNAQIMSTTESIPAWVTSLRPEHRVQLDVRPILAGGTDPLQRILGALQQLQRGQVLEIINSFEPRPLRSLLAKRGFSSYAETLQENLVHTYFARVEEQPIPVTEAAGEPQPPGNWTAMLELRKDGLRKLDVRGLEKPQPMLRVLAALDALNPGEALLVDHERVPVFLLTELADREWEYRVQTWTDEHVQLLIFKS